jgi:hypothetical protein
MPDPPMRFQAGGALPIAGADEIAPMINDLIKEAIGTAAQGHRQCQTSTLKKFVT